MKKFLSAMCPNLLKYLWFITRLKRGEAVDYFPQNLTIGFACRRSRDGLWAERSGKLIGKVKFSYRRREGGWGVFLILGERSYAFGWNRPYVTRYAEDGHLEVVE